MHAVHLPRLSLTRSHATLHAAILDGELLAGSVASDSMVELIYGSQRMPLRIKGVFVGTAMNQSTDDLSLMVELGKRPAMREEFADLASRLGW
jgi:hypothetical protein